MGKNLHACLSVIQKHRNLSIISILIYTVIIYLPVFKNVLTNWDDDHYVLLNPFIQSLSFSNIKEIFSSYYAGNYHPLTMLSLAFNYNMRGIEPWTFQLTNLILHLCNTLLVYLFARRLLKQGATDEQVLFIPLFSAFLFGIHPFHVESVAWISERKNVLYTFFFLLSLVTYTKYLASNSLKFYIATLFLFLLSLLSKGMAIPLSLCIICIDYFAGRSLLSQKVILEKIPFLALSLIFGIVAVYAQHAENTLRTGENFLLPDRIAYASYGFIQYMVKLCFPFQLSAFYPYPVKHGSFLPFIYYACIPLVLTLFYVVWRYFRNNRTIIFGSLFFLSNISIVIQLLPVGDAILADRYVYVPSVGFFLIMGYCFNKLWKKSTIAKYSVISFIAMYGVVLGFKTFTRVGVWKDSITLWDDALKNYPENNDRGYLNRGNKLQETGNYEGARRDYERLLKISPKNVAGYIGMGHLKYAQKDLPGALKNFNTALSLQKVYEAFISRTVVKMDLGNFEGALADADSAYQLDPARTDALVNKGSVYLQTGKYTAAMEHFNIVLLMEPSNNKAYKGRALTKKAMNDAKGALVDLNTYISLANSYDGYLERATLKMLIPDYQGAKSDLYSAMYLNPGCVEVYLNLGIIELNSDNTEDAIKNFNKAESIESGNPIVYLYRAIAYLNLAKYTEALENLNISIQLKQDAEAYYYRGYTLLQLGKKHQGCSDLNQALSMGSNHAKKEVESNCR